MSLYNEKLKLPPAFPSSPQRPPKFSVSFIHGDDGLITASVCEHYALWHIVTGVLADREFQWLSDTEVETTDDEGPKLRVRGDVDEALAYEPGPVEKRWQVPEPYATTIRRLRGDDSRPVQDPSEAINYPPAERKGRKRAKNRKNPVHDARKARERMPKVEGLIGIAQICEEAGIDPRAARAILRSKETKPDHGWAWMPEEVERIKKLLKGSK